jgi:hypothetical protein
LEDTQENEQLTDLATIQAGLSVLILNGMSKDTRWLMTIIALCFGMLYWHSEQKAFGYFQPKQYGQQARRYFGEKNIPLHYIIGHVLPAARFFIPGGWRTRAQKKTRIIEMFEKRRLRANLIEVAIAIVAIGALIGFVNWEEQKDAAQRNLSNEIVNCKSEAESMEASMGAKEARLESMEAEMGRYEASGNNRRYNELVEPYNQLLREIQNDYAAYDKAVDDCNASINNYNSNL